MSENLNRFYVYIHRELDTNRPFYVGKGTAERAWNKSTRSDFWKNVERKHGRKVEIVFDNLTEDEAFQVEKDTILEFEYFGYRLVNLTKGGDGVRGMKFTEESKQKMSIAQKTSEKVKAARQASAEARRGIKHTKDHSSKISKALKGKPKTEAHRSNAKLAKCSKTLYNFKHTDGRTFSGTRLELESFSGLTRLQISSLFVSRPNNSTKGWSLTT
jgi:hypothetical protein